MCLSIVFDFDGTIGHFCHVVDSILCFTHCVQDNLSTKKKSLSWKLSEIKGFVQTIIKKYLNIINRSNITKLFYLLYRLKHSNENRTSENENKKEKQKIKIVLFTAGYSPNSSSLAGNFFLTNHTSPQQLIVEELTHIDTSIYLPSITTTPKPLFDNFVFTNGSLKDLNLLLCNNDDHLKNKQIIDTFIILDDVSLEKNYLSSSTFLHQENGSLLHMCLKPHILSPMIIHSQILEISEIISILFSQKYRASFGSNEKTTYFRSLFKRYPSPHTHSHLSLDIESSIEENVGNEENGDKKSNIPNYSLTFNFLKNQIVKDISKLILKGLDLKSCLTKEKKKRSKDKKEKKKKRKKNKKVFC